MHKMVSKVAADLTMDDLVNTLSAEGLAKLLSHKTLGSLSEFNGFPVEYKRMDDGSYGQVVRINGGPVEWDHHWLSSIGGRRTGYNEQQDRVGHFNGHPASYIIIDPSDIVPQVPRYAAIVTVHDAPYDPSEAVTGIALLNGCEVKNDGRGRIAGINGHPVIRVGKFGQLETVIGLNNRAVVYRPDGSVLKANGHPARYSGTQRPAAQSVLLLAALFPPVHRT